MNSNKIIVNYLNQLVDQPLLINPTYGLHLLSKLNSTVEIASVSSSNSFLDTYFKEQKEQSAKVSIKPLLGIKNLDSINPTLAGSIRGNDDRKILEINIRDQIQMADGWCTEGMESKIQNISNLLSTENIVGLFVSIDSPGGEAIASNKMQAYLASLKIPIVAHVDLCASGGYMIATSANYIMASSESSYIGSIGTVVTLSKEALKYIKENYIYIFADKSENKMGEFRKALDDDFSGFKDMTNRFRDIFANIVIKSRGIEPDSNVLSGSMHTAKEAKKLNLIDSIGSYSDAYNKLISLL